MTTNLMPWQRACDCLCPLHTRQIRPTYDDPDCACAITCATQPITLLAERWGAALFLDRTGDIWQVPALADGTWDWNNASEIDTRSEYYHASVVIQRLLQAAAHLFANPSY